MCFAKTQTGFDIITISTQILGYYPKLLLLNLPFLELVANENTGVSYPFTPPKKLEYIDELDFEILP